MKHAWLVLIAALFSTGTFATEQGTTTTIQKIYSYTQFGGGDVQVLVTLGATNCGGFWLKPSDPGFKAALSMLLSAYLAKSQVMIYGLDNDLWPGSPSGTFCHITTVVLVPN